jgi:hypothetical protein
LPVKILPACADSAPARSPTRPPNGIVYYGWPGGGAGRRDLKGKFRIFAFLALFALFAFDFLLLFLEERGGDGGDREVAVGDRGRDALGHLDGADVDAVADVEPGQVELELLGDVVDAAQHLDLVADDVQEAAALDARALLFVDEDARHVDVGPRRLGDAQEINMQCPAVHGVELHVARQHPLRAAAADVHRINGREKAAGVELFA